jgi:hypothetical protein
VPAAGIHAQIFEGNSVDAQAWLVDHRIFGRLLLPGAAVLEAFYAGAVAALGTARPQLGGFAMHRPLFLPEPGEAPAHWQIVATVAAHGKAALELHEAVTDGWRLVASATADGSAAPPPHPMRGAVRDGVDVDAVYRRFAALVVEFGPSFRCLRDIRRGEGYVEGWVDLPNDIDADRHTLHPVMLDAALQLCSVAAASGPAGELPAQVMLPLGADRFCVLRSAPDRLLVRVRTRAGGSLAADVTLETPDGDIVAILDGMRFAPAQPGAFSAPHSANDSLYEVVWQRANRPTTIARADGTWLVFADRGGVADRLAGELETAGGRCIRVMPGETFRATGLPPLRGIIHLWNLDLAPLDQPADPEQEDRLGIGSVLHLVQELTEPSPLWVVTRGAHSVTGTEPVHSLRPRAAGVWGLASVIAVEQPEWNIRRVDLDPGEDACRGLAAEILSADGASIAIRNHERSAWSWFARALSMAPSFVAQPRSPSVRTKSDCASWRPGSIFAMSYRRLVCTRARLSRSASSVPAS